MNERIRELANEVGISVEYLTNTKQIVLLEQFARLIVRECASICKDRKLTPSAFTADELLKHFGVE